MKFLRLFMAIALVFAFSVSADATVRHFTAEVVEVGVDGIAVPVTDTITYKVLAVGSDTTETIGSDAVMTSKTNPVTTTIFAATDRIDFFCDPTDATNDRAVDLIVVDTDGYAVFFEDFRYDKNHLITINKVGPQRGMIWFSAATSAAYDTGIDFPYDAKIKNVGIEIVTAAVGTSTIDVGLLSTETSGDADGFIDGVAGSVVGFIGLSITTSGTMLDNGTNIYPGGHVVTGANAKSLTYLSNTNSTVAGYLYWDIERLR